MSRPDDPEAPDEPGAKSEEALGWPATPDEPAAPPPGPAGDGFDGGGDWEEPFQIGPGTPETDLGEL